jgi:hypothetical protein
MLDASFPKRALFVPMDRSFRMHPAPSHRTWHKQEATARALAVRESDAVSVASAGLALNTSAQ